MSYTYGTSNIKKNNYDVYIRSHKAAETINKDTRLKAFMNDFNDITTEATLITAENGSNIDTDFTSLSYINYNLDASGGALDTVDFDNETTSNLTEGDVIVFTATDVSNAVSVTDENDLEVVFTYAGDKHAFHRLSGAWVWLCQMASGSSTLSELDDFYTKIGGCEEKPSIKSSQGQAIMLSNGDELTVSENLEVTFNDLQVDESNYEFLRSLSNVDVCLYNSNTSSAIFVYDIEAQAFLEATGNDLNKVVVNVKLETDDVDNHLTIYAAV